MTTTFRIERWTDDDGRSGGGCQYTVIEIAADGTETDALTTNDEDKVREFIADQGGVIVEDV